MNYHDKVRANDFDRRVGEIQTLKAIELGTGNSILDIGCGIGQYTPLFLYRFKRVVGLDPSEEYLKEARSAGWNIEYIKGYGESFSLDEKFDTISMNNILEHVDDPIRLLENCRKHLNPCGRLIAQVPNSVSITRRIGVLMGIIDDTNNITEKEREFYGHKRTYKLQSLIRDCELAGLGILEAGGILYKPLPNEILEELCVAYGKDWADRFINALVQFGKYRPEECACIYTVCVR